MAESVKVIDPDSGTGYDYDSLYDWEAAQQADIDSTGTQAVAKCRCTGGTADTTDFTIDGWTTSADDYIKIWTDPAEAYRHNGTYQTGNKYRLEISDPSNISVSRNAILVKEQHCRFIGLQIKLTGSGAADTFIGIAFDSVGSPNNAYIESCIFDSTYTGATNAHRAINSYASYGPYKISNNIVSNFNLDEYDTGKAISIDYDTHYIYNNTFIACLTGVRRTGGTLNLKNNLFSGCTLDAEGTISDSYCATTNDNTKGLSSGGTGNRFSQTFSFVGAADFHLQSSDTGALGYGTNLYNDANYPFQTDIDGEDRGGSGANWDIGADEYVAAGSTYQVTATDGLKGSESLARILTAIKSASDGVKASDAAITAYLIQHSFRFRNDDESEVAATWKAALNADLSLGAGNTFRLRYLINALNDPAVKQFQIEYRRKPSGGEFGPWKQIN